MLSQGRCWADGKAWGCAWAAKAVPATTAAAFFEAELVSERNRPRGHFLLLVNENVSVFMRHPKMYLGLVNIVCT